jgi:hypothetical protein
MSFWLGVHRPHWLGEMGTGLTIAEHQRRTTANYVELRGRWPFIPVLQGSTADDYLRSAELLRVRRRRLAGRTAGRGRLGLQTAEHPRGRRSRRRSSRCTSTASA